MYAFHPTDLFPHTFHPVKSLSECVTLKALPRKTKLKAWWYGSRPPAAWTCVTNCGLDWLWLKYYCLLWHKVKPWLGVLAKNICCVKVISLLFHVPFPLSKIIVCCFLYNGQDLLQGKSDRRGRAGSTWE